MILATAEHYVQNICRRGIADKKIGRLKAGLDVAT